MREKADNLLQKAIEKIESIEKKVVIEVIVAIEAVFKIKRKVH